MLTFSKRRKPHSHPKDIYFPYHFSLTGGLSIYLESALELDDEQIKVFQSHLPGLEEMTDAQIAAKKPLDPNWLTIKYSLGDRTRLEMTNHGSVRHISPDAKQISPDFLHLFYGVARLAWLKRNLCPVHAACVGFEGDDHILIVGHAGVGKTSATLSCVTKKKMKVFSGDKTIIDLSAPDHIMTALAGTQVMTLRNSDIDRWPNLGLTPSGDRYIGKLAPEHQCQKQQVKIKAVVLININDGADRTKSIIPLSALHMLFPYFTDKERGDVILDGGTAFFDGSMSLENKAFIACNLREALQNTPTYHITGSIEYITEGISNIAGEPKLCVNQSKRNRVL